MRKKICIIICMVLVLIIISSIVIEVTLKNITDKFYEIIKEISNSVEKYMESQNSEDLKQAQFNMSQAMLLVRDTWRIKDEYRSKI